ncbi:aminoacyl-tRNA hydrolase [Patescibacteria group bacterium]|nr:aminoacyl-tRNA hydrolase [Patescibacteria group bacterium]MDE1946325.1 aminoacyl-tRNA hydrolase [Patescibacteria group bacterium]MDE2010777.1 aminoacyl-tRNA hydrolase [Patescibacteria group bacterium]MDE2232662.1 aminoacyl-tRNA hydrolase [Patescibacteria group bacterium]
MSYVLMGLGNPGEEYEGARHNTGRFVVDRARDRFGGEFKEDKKINALMSKGKIGKEVVIFAAPNTFMNKSGTAAVKLVKSKKAAERLIVIYDDFSLPLGRIKISFNRSSGGHNGLESVIKALKTEAFVRIRVGIAPETAKGLAKAPHGDDKIIRFILGKYKPDELKILNKIAKEAVEAVETIVKYGKEKAMSVYNTR